MSARTQWHIIRSETEVTLSRRLPVRFDLEARARFPLLRKLRLAHQIRQDMWRALRDLRGFSPAVAVTVEGEALLVRAGGRIEGAFPRAQSERVVSALLQDPEYRARWCRHAAVRARP